MGKKRLGHFVLADLTPVVLADARDAFLAEKTPRGTIRNTSTVNRYIVTAFSRALTIAMKEWGWIDDTPMRKLSKPPEGKGRNRLLSLEETKNGEGRILPLTSALEKVFTLCRKVDIENGLVFKPSSPTNRSGLVDIRNTFVKALKQANIHNFRFHDLRHAAASDLVCSIALGGVSKKPDVELHELLKRAPFLSLDFDDPGKKRYSFWMPQYPNLRPCSYFKSPGDALEKSHINM